MVDAANYPKVGVGIIIIKEGKVLLGKRTNPNHGYGTWDFPGGKVNFGEKPEDCVLREAMEETGVKVKSIKFFSLTNDIFDEKRHYITLFYTCKIESGEPKGMEPERCDGWEWFEWEKMPSPLFLTIEHLLEQKITPFD